MSGSDGEVDDPPEMESDEDLSDGDKHTHEEVRKYSNSMQCYRGRNECQLG